MLRGRVLQDVRFAWRAIAQNKMLAAVVTVSLAVGIGVNTAVFSWLEALVVTPIPGVTSASRFVLIEPRSDTGSYPGASWPEYMDLRGSLASAADPLAFRMTPFTIGVVGQTTRSVGLVVSGNYFTALGLKPYRGRLIAVSDASRPGGEPVVVISYGFWQSYYGGGEAAIGRSLRVNGRPLTVVGVAPPRFQGTVLGVNFDLWAPATLAPVLFPASGELDDRSARGYAIMTELSPGASRWQAQSELNAAMRELARTFPATNARVTADVLPFWQSPRGPQRMLADAVGILQIVVLLLLAAVCGNTASLLLARATARHKEIAIRMTVGATRWDITRAITLESLLLSGMGVVLGLAIAAWGTDALRAAPVIGAFPIRFQTNVDRLGVGFSAALGVGCALAFGWAPAAYLGRLDPATALRIGSSGPHRSTLRRALLAGETALATVVLVAAGLFLRSFNESRGLDPGFRRDGVLLSAYDFTGRGLDDAAAREFVRRLLEKLERDRSVQSAAVAAAVPLDIHGLPARSIAVEGRTESDAAPRVALSNTVTPGYFGLLDIPFVEGHDFAALDDAAAPPQAVVNEAFVRRFVGDGQVIGRRVESRGRAFVIAGVVRDTVADAFGESFKPIVYFSYRDRPAARGEIHVRAAPGAEPLLASAVERAVRELDPALPVYDVRTMAEHIDKNLFLQRIPARMFVVLGPLLLALAGIGVYAVASYSVSRRRGEIALRLAIGARPARLVREVAGDTFRVVAAGAAGGWMLAALVAIHLVRGFPLSVFASVPVAVLAIAALACWIPARRASAVDPSTALRDL